MADTSIYKGIRGYSDYQQEAQAQGLQSALAAAQIAKAQSDAMGLGGSTPAAIQVANEYQKARQVGDLQRMNDIELFSKALDKGLVTSVNGGVGTMQGYGQAAGEIAATKKGMEQQASKGVDLYMNPQIKLEEEKGKAIGKELGGAAASLSSQRAKFPELQRNVQELKELGKTATYTQAGQTINTLGKEAGFKPSKGAVNRTAYIAKIDNQILPLLRDTFGAAFTAAEGERLRDTLGDPNKTPDEKDAVLDAFIAQKEADLEALNRQIGGEEYFTTPTFGDGMGNAVEAPQAEQYTKGKIYTSPSGQKAIYTGTGFRPVK